MPLNVDGSIAGGVIALLSIYCNASQPLNTFAPIEVTFAGIVYGQDSDNCKKRSHAFALHGSIKQHY